MAFWAMDQAEQKEKINTKNAVRFTASKIMAHQALTLKKEN
jgi:hypothetical protein